MNNVWIIRYGYNYGHDTILGIYSTKKLATESFKVFSENSPKYDYCYIEKFKIDKTYKGK